MFAFLLCHRAKIIYVQNKPSTNEYEEYNDFTENGLPPPISTNGIPPENQLCLDIVNKERENNGLSPLTYNEKLSEVVYPHNEGMINGSVPFGHDGFSQRFRQAGRWCSAGENVAYCYAKNYTLAVPKLMQMWMNSAGHRANILGSFTHAGFAFGNAKGDLTQPGYYYGTQFFAKECNW